MYNDQDQWRIQGIRVRPHGRPLPQSSEIFSKVGCLTSFEIFLDSIIDLSNKQKLL